MKIRNNYYGCDKAGKYLDSVNANVEFTSICRTANANTNLQIRNQQHVALT